MATSKAFLAGLIFFVHVGLGLGAEVGARDDPRRNMAERRALAFLAREAPAWPRAHGCFSCHNNGDAARALYAAVRVNDEIAPEALADTSAFLRTPDAWDRKAADEPFRDQRLAALQFAAALAAAFEARQVRDRGPLLKAAQMVADHQAENGSWPVDVSSTVGSPTAYGPALATVMGREILLTADPEVFREPSTRAETWLRKVAVQNLVEAASVLRAFGADDLQAAEQRQRAFALLRRGQSRDGGWGPYVNAAPETFDTALALWGLAGSADQPEAKQMIRRGRAYLIAQQQPDGSWSETTRPSGAVSYAQRISTTAWATLALLVTREEAQGR